MEEWPAVCNVMNLLMKLSIGFYENKQRGRAPHANTETNGFLDVVATELSWSWKGEGVEDIPFQGAVS